MIKAIFIAAAIVALAVLAGMWLLVFGAWLYHCWVHREQH